MKSKRHKKLGFSDRNWDTMRLLSLHQPFLADVARIRQKVGIPESGFDIEAATLWLTNLYAKDAKFLSWQRIVTALLRKYELAPSFHEAVEVYLRTGLLIRPQSFNFEVHDAEDSSVPKKVVVTIFGPLTKKDWAWLKVEVDGLMADSSGKVKRQRARTNLERDMKILRDAVNDGKKMTDAELVTNIFDGKRGGVGRAADQKRMRILRQARLRLRQATKKRPR